MSQAQLKKLNALLVRVQQRRQEPRLVAIGGGAAPSANTNLAAPALKLEPARQPSIQDAIAPASPSSMPPPAAPSSMPPPAFRTPLPPSKPSTSTVPPPEHQVRAHTEVLPAVEARGLPAREQNVELPPTAGVRVAASPALPFDSAVRVTSSPRVEAPKSFGDLLELSLALRPKTG